MTFAAIEASRKSGRPFTLYYFKYGDAGTSYHGYTDADRDIVYAGKTYVAVPINRGSINAQGTLDRTSLELTFPANSELAKLYRFFPPARVVTVIIRQGHFDDPEGEIPVVWSGRVLSAGMDGDEMRFTCEPVSTSMRRTGLRRHYQYGCPHALYGKQCKASKTAATRTTEIVSASSNIITLPTGWDGSGKTPAQYRGGLVEWDNADGSTELRTILGASTNTIRVNGDTRDLADGATVSVTLGCNHQMTDCKNLHKNIVNFGGQPWIPKKSPVGSRNSYY